MHYHQRPGGIIYWALPDASTGHDPDSLARKLSRRAPRERSEQRGCKERLRQGFGVRRRVCVPRQAKRSRGRTFCRLLASVALAKEAGYNFYWALRVSRYKYDRSQKTVTVQYLYCDQMRVSGCKNHYKFILSAGAKAKSVTNNLPILSVL